METSFACEPFGVTCAVLSAASCAAKAASLRRNACSGVSPGRMSREGLIVTTGGASCGAGSDSIAPSAEAAGSASAVDVRSSAAGGLLAFAFGFLRLAGFQPNWRLSHRRIVSRPTLMPIRRRPPTRDSADSPTWANRSNSSRCGSNWAVAWSRGCRAWATAWVSVVGRAVASGEWMGSDMGVDGAPYAWWSGSARGAPRAQSKRKRLDVGVIPHCFLFDLVDRLIGFSGFFVDLRFGRFGWLKLSVGSWFEWIVLGELVELLSSGFLVDPCSGILGWVSGGGRC